jgi:hypothetical protein
MALATRRLFATFVGKAVENPPCLKNHAVAGHRLPDPRFQ